MHLQRAFLAATQLGVSNVTFLVTITGLRKFTFLITYIGLNLVLRLGLSVGKSIAGSNKCSRNLNIIRSLIRGIGAKGQLPKSNLWHKSLITDSDAEFKHTINMNNCF